mgnify:CR=1 FL=1
MANNAQNVSVGKPKVAGAIHVAPVGTSLPTDATTALGAGFSQLGYVSDAGLTNGTNLEVSKIKAWGGDIIYDVQTEKPDTWKMAFAEATNEEVLKLVYGADNITGNISTGLTIKANSQEQAAQSLVIDMVLANGGKKRVVLPNCKVTAVSDITYADGDVVKYETTLSCYPDSNGNTHYEYIVEGTAPSF